MVGFAWYYFSIAVDEHSAEGKPQLLAIK